MIGGNAMATAQGLIDQMVTVTEKNTALAILRLLEMEKAVVEGAGAVGLAAFIEHKLPQLVGKRSDFLKFHKRVIDFMRGL